MKIIIQEYDYAQILKRTDEVLQEHSQEPNADEGEEASHEGGDSDGAAAGSEEAGSGSEGDGSDEAGSGSDGESLISEDAQEEEEGDVPQAPAAQSQPQEKPLKVKRKRKAFSLEDVIAKHRAQVDPSYYLYLVYAKAFRLVKVGITRLDRKKLLRRYRTYYHQLDVWRMYKINNGKAKFCCWLALYIDTTIACFL